MTKRCFRCGVEKELSEFYSHPETADGHLNKCKDCTRGDVRGNYVRNHAHYRAYDRQRHRRVGRVPPFVLKARRAVSNALRDGRLIRQPCEVCGKWAEAHHDDYTHPLEVRWLCFRHHRKFHGQMVAV